MIFPAFVKITQLNSAGPHTTSACQELFSQIFANFLQLSRTRPGLRRLGQSKLFSAIVEKRLDKLVSVLYNRRGHFNSLSYYYLVGR